MNCSSMYSGVPYRNNQLGLAKTEFRYPKYNSKFTITATGKQWVTTSNGKKHELVG